jgi:hypothetical protein
MPSLNDGQLRAWLDALERRHMADLEFAEVTRALRALSSTYVERRARLAERSAFDSAGKRAAYALFYSPLHYLTVREIARALGVASAGEAASGAVVDLGCGGGAAGAAWAVHTGGAPPVIGIDSHPWALAEAAFTYKCFGLDGSVRRGHAARVTLPRRTGTVILGWVLNELDDASRAALQRTLLSAAAAGARVLIVEPIATRVSPWWEDWSAAFVERGARADEWRFPVTLPDLLQRFDRAAGMRHDELKARSLWIG